MPSGEAAVSSNQEYRGLSERKHGWRSFGVAVLILVVLLASGFRPEMHALLWHARHGNTFDFHGARFRVPRLAYVAQPAPDQATITIGRGLLRGVGRVQSSTFYLSFTSGPTPSSQEDLSNHFRATLEPVGERRMAMLGAMMVCRESVNLPTGLHTIECERTSPGIVPGFVGPVKDVPTFSRLLASATSVAAPTSADAP